MQTLMKLTGSRLQILIFRNIWKMFVLLIYIVAACRFDFQNYFEDVCLNYLHCKEPFSYFIDISSVSVRIALKKCLMNNNLHIIRQVPDYV